MNQYGRLDKNDPQDKKAVDDLLRTCCSACEGKTADFINSLATQWDHHGYLTERQFSALKKIHDGL